jgi:hypothetical protein
MADVLLNPFMRFFLKSLRSVAIASAIWLSSFAAQADTRLEKTLKSGEKVVLVVLGNGERKKPKSTIVVCSDGAYDDFGAVSQVAKTYLADENYEILDASKLDKRFDFEGITFAYFGDVPLNSGNPICLGTLSGVFEYAKLTHVIGRQQAAKLNAQLQKQFKTREDVVGQTPTCIFGSPSAQIDGQNFNWSIQLRNSSKSRCAESYFSLFGFNKICLTAVCGYDETEKVISELK